jgi:hypothetical protein
MKRKGKKTKLILIFIFLLILLIINTFVLYLIKNPKQVDCYKDILESKFQSHVSGEVMIDFVQDVTKEEVDTFLSSYHLSSDEINYPLINEYRVDFTGDTEGFLEYLNQSGFVRQPNRIPNYFIFIAKEGINCKMANDIFYSYPNVSVTKTYCFGHVWGIVKVKKGTEGMWICRLRKSEIVANTGFNGILTAS